MCEFPAHIHSEKNNGKIVYDVQSAQEHCRHVAEYSGKALNSLGLYHVGYLAGLVHDCGKFKQEFADYLWKAYRGEPVKRGSVNHTFAGCRMILEHCHSGINDLRDVTCELLAYSIGAHHGQFDCIAESGKSGFRYRMEKENIGYKESTQNFLRYCAGRTELDRLLQSAHEELTPVYEKIVAAAEKNGDAGIEQMMFELGQLARLLLSAIIEGDRRDTAEFMSNLAPQKNISDYSEFWRKYLICAEQKLHEFPHETEIQIARNNFSNICRSAAEKPTGIYRLNLPTGGGKTLSALRYALAHASRWKKHRIVFVTPLLSILEQNAAVIRDFIQDDAIILEHHSNVAEPKENADELNINELALDSWDAPIIITTMVQLLNTLFLGKTTSIRRYQSLCSAVVVIDEVQTVPNHMLSLFNTAVNFLSSICGTTFLLCSATQPCFDEADHPLDLGENSELVPYRPDLWKPFKRTDIHDSGSLRLDQIPGFAQNVLKENNSLLIICNKKSQSKYLFHAIAADQIRRFYLSSFMCTEHRRTVLRAISDSLNRKDSIKTLCVSTQVMEAGVDISFDCVIRIAAGMDSIVQSAGRCNRNGEHCVPAPVYILQCADENLGMLREIREGKQATAALLNRYHKNPEKFENDLASDKSIEWYYRKLYHSQPSGYQQFTVDKNNTIFDMLGSNLKASGKEDYNLYTLNQAFKTAGNLFRALDDSTNDVVVPYGKGADLIAEISSYSAPVSPEWLREWIRRARPYTVSLYEYQKEILADGIVDIQGVLVLRPEYYSDQTGLIIKPETIFLEV